MDPKTEGLLNALSALQFDFPRPGEAAFQEAMSAVFAWLGAQCPDLPGDRFVVEHSHGSEWRVRDRATGRWTGCGLDGVPKSSATVFGSVEDAERDADRMNAWHREQRSESSPWNHPPRVIEDGEAHPLWPSWRARVEPTVIGGWKKGFKAWWERDDGLRTQEMTIDSDDGPLHGSKGPGRGYWMQVGSDAELEKLDRRHPEGTCPCDGCLARRD